MDLPRSIQVACVALLAVVALGVAALWVSMREVHHAVVALQPSPRGEPVEIDVFPLIATTVQTTPGICLTESWESKKCGTVVIETCCGFDYQGNPLPAPESREDCLARHLAEIEAWEKLCPPVE